MGGGEWRNGGFKSYLSSRKSKIFFFLKEYGRTDLVSGTFPMYLVKRNPFPVSQSGTSGSIAPLHQTLEYVNESFFITY